ncbi:hypothetical protein [Paenibacillus lutimineralis]|uniref:Uncharacterized protein n=1 Tax=Paenibacillus lutimineralis TaxID=2707005 RepID=A0A3Q9I8I3_9BACL|nr:hypothetical protein [Paenibacillus lutimineralis]AZS13541.1 hypothetical protein EI981_02985 [Paenibacillus lutimineralis]
MQIKYMDWQSDQDFEGEYLAMTYHLNSNHYQQLDVLTRSRMKMLKNLFMQMNQAVTPAKRYFAAERFKADELYHEGHPYIAELLASLEKLQRTTVPFWDFESLKNLGPTDKLDALDLYFLSKSQTSGSYVLFYYSPAEKFVEYVKEEEGARWWNKTFDKSLEFRDGDLALFITANINRTIRLFGERGYRLCMLEGGRMTERLVRSSQESGRSLVPVMTFYDKPVQELLGVDGYYDVVLSSLIFRGEE